MASTLFPARVGVVGVHYGLDALPVHVHLIRSDMKIQFETPMIMKAILTGFDLVGEGAVSTNLTLRQKIYTTVVGGEKPGVIQLTGLWFPDICLPDTANTQDTGLTGIDALMILYEAIRVATTGHTVFVHIARTIRLIGVVKKFTARLADPSTGVGEWAYLLDYMPRSVINVNQDDAELVGSLSAQAIAGAVR